MPRRSLQEILSSDEAFSTAPMTGEDDAFSRYLAAYEPQRRREESAATEGVLNNLQSRGLARSGIALKDIVTQVLGPSQERAGQLASQFGLEQARTATANREAARGRRLSAILQSDQGDISQLIAQEQQDAENRRASAANKNARRNAIVGAIGGAAGSAIEAWCFTPNTEIHMADGSKKEIGEVQIGDQTAGGKVLSVRRSLANDLCDYVGVRVTSSHAVNEDGTWRRVKHSILCDRIEASDVEVVSLVTGDHRIFVDDMAGNKVEFSDEAEHDLSARLGGYMTDEQTLITLNMAEQLKRASRLVEAK